LKDKISKTLKNEERKLNENKRENNYYEMRMLIFR
jgi:hypothetical protein